MKQFLRHIFLLFALFMTTTNAWAAWTGSGAAIKEVNGTYYVVYQDSYETLNTIETGPTILLSGPGELLQYEAKGSSSLTGAGRKYFYYSYSTNNGGNWTDKSQDLTTSYAPYEASLANNVNAIRFLTKTGSTYTKEVKNIRVTMAQYIENPSKTTIEFGSGKVDDTNSVASFTIPWCNVPAMTYTIEGSGSDCINISVANNSEHGKYNTATFTITYDRTKASNLDATLTIKNSYNNYSKTIIITGSTSKYDQTLSWNNESAIEANMQLGKTQTVTATATSGLAVTYSSSDNSVLTVDASGKITAVRIGDATITASQAGNYKYNAAPSITKTYTVWNKNTPIFTPNGFNEANVCHLKVGDKVTLEVLNVSDGLSGDFKVNTDNNILGITRNGNTITIEALNAGTADAIFTQTENNDIFGAEKKYQFSVSKINNTLAIASTSYTRYVDDEITNIISSVNSDAAVTTSSSDATIAYYDVTGDKILIPNSEAKSFSSKAITITIAQAETYKYTAAEKTITLTINKYTPTFTWNSANTPYYYGTSIPNIFSTTNSDATSPVTFESSNAAFAHVENNTLYIANARETANITVTQAENYKWNKQQAVYPISPVNGSKHVPFKIDTDAKFTLFKQSTSSNCSWSGNKIKFYTADWSDKYYDIHFEGIPDVVTFNYDADWAATGLEWFVQESSNGTDWSAKTWSSTSNSGSATITLQSSTRYLRFCYSGNLNGYISNINVTERFQFEATPTKLDFGTNGINHGKQEETVTFQHANAGRITKAEITGKDAQYFGVKPADITSTGRDLYGTARLQVSFDNRGAKRGDTPYNAVLTIYDNAEHSIDIPLSGIRNGKSTPDFIWNPNAMPYYFNTTIANIAYSTNKDANYPLTYTSSDNTIAEVKDGDLHIYAIGQEVTITVHQADNNDYIEHTESFTFTPCERPSLEVPFRVSQNLHEKSMQLGTKCRWEDDSQIRMADPLGDGFMWGDERKRLLITFAGVPDKLYFEFHSKSSTLLPPTPENAIDAWIVEESPNGVDWTIAWRTSNVSTDWVASGEIDLKPNTQYIRFNYKGNFAGYIRNIIISSLEGNNFLRAEEGTYLSRGAKYGTQAVVDPFGIACRVSRFTVDNTNIYTRFQFVDNMQYLWETHDTKELFTDDKTAANTANLWQIPDASGKFTIQSGNDLGSKGQYLTISDNLLTLTSEPTQATIWHMESADEHSIVLKNYMDAAAANAAKKDFGVEINTLDKVRSNIDVQDFEVTEIAVPQVALAEQSGEYRDGINGTFDVYDDTITDLKPGFYRLTVKALYRISTSEYAQDAKSNNLESVVAYIYANDVKYPIQSVYDSHNGNSYDTSDEYFNQHYYPTQLQPSVAKAFSETGRYLNDVYVYVNADEGKTTGTLHYGIKNPSFVPGAWLAYSTVTLTHFGRKDFIFDGGDNGTSTDWNSAGNWNRDSVPNQYHNVIIRANVNIATSVSAYSMTIEEDKKVHVTNKGGITIGCGGVKETSENSITIDNNPDGAGFLRVHSNATIKPKRVTINYTTRAKAGGVKDQVWQYVGAPGDSISMSNDGVQIYHWSEQYGWVYANSQMQPFTGYAITRTAEGSETYPITATPITRDQTIELTYTPGAMEGGNLFVNSYLAPIDLTKFEDDDFEGEVEKTFYLFNSGSWQDWQNNGGSSNTMTGDGSSPGQYYAITPLGATLMDSEIDQTIIPTMQGVYVVANEGGGKIYLNYNKHVYNGKTSNVAMRAPQRMDENFIRVRMQVNSENSGADRMYIIQHDKCTKGYDNGYDAKNILAEGQANIYTNEKDGKMEISVANQIDSTYIGFQAGSDSEYTLTFTSLVGEDMYLHDLVEDSLFLLVEDGQYTFSAQANSVNDMRFQLILHPELPGQDEPEDNMTTGMDNVMSSARVWVNDKRIYIAAAPQNSTIAVYTVSGMCITSPLTIHEAPCTVDLSHLPTGVYVLRLNNQAYKFVCK